jgi:double-strand break repair protein MRE11
LDGEWEEQPGAIILSENDAEGNEDVVTSHSVQPATRGRGGTAAARKPTTRKAPAKSTTKTPASKSTRGKKKVVESEDEDDDDVVMIDPEPDAPKSTRKAATRLSTKTSKPSQTTRQTKLNFASQMKDWSEDEISDDDDDAFEPASTTSSRKRR